MSSNKTISVIIPAHNAADTIGETIDSLRAQAFPHWEAIVVDDGSTDDTFAIALRLATNEPRIQVLHQPQRGVCAARNAGLALAQSNWLVFLDADDWLLPGYFDQMLGRLEEDSNLDIVHCGWARATALTSPLSVRYGPTQSDLFPVLARRCPFAVHACLVRREPVEAAHGFDPALVICQDWDLWQRLARSGARFGLVREPLALYRMRPGSASGQAQQFLNEGLGVIVRGHGFDPRVPSALPQYRDGLPATGLSETKLHFASWVAGLVLGRKADARPLLEMVKDDRAPGLDPTTVAQGIFDAGAHAQCLEPSAWAGFWPQIEQQLDHFLSALEAHSGCALLARRSKRILERLVVECTTQRPVTIGATEGIKVEITAPLPDIVSDADRLHCLIVCDGDCLGSVELPVCDGAVSREVVADAIAAEFAWPILGRFFERTVYRELSLNLGPTGLTIQRGQVRLADGAVGDEKIGWRQLHDAVGWTVFLQETWACPDWPPARFYDPQPVEGTDTERTLRIESRQISIEISADLPNIETAASELEVVLKIGGVNIGTVSVPVKDHWLPKEELRAALTTASGLELCCACVREALLGQPLDWPASLRTRLGLAAQSKANTTQANDNVLLLGRRSPEMFGTSGSRRAALPAESAFDLSEAALITGEPINAPVGLPDRVMYAPDLIIHSSHAAPSAASLRAAIPRASAPAHDRAHFETLFARQSDPWKYTAPYEQTKYEQTLSLLPRRSFGRALEAACAEGHFTAQLAPRVKHLVAVDISQIALERAAERCARFKNIQYLRMDLSHDPLPGQFDLIVCSEVLYYVGGVAELKTVAMKMAVSLKPGGFLITAHAYSVADDPAQPGFDWDVPYGAKVIGEILGGTPGLRLIRELRTPLYRIQLFQRTRSHWSAFQRAPQITALAQQPTPLPADAAAHVLWQGGLLAPQKTAAAVTRSLPLLMYHHIAYGGPPELERFRLTPAAFEAQLKYLSEAGYYTVNLADWHKAKEAKKPLPGRAIVLTFDDGYEDFRTEAWPLLQRYGFSALVFLVADLIGQTSTWDRVYGEEAPLLAWDAIRDLQAAGVEFGSHSASHAPLTGLSPAQVVGEAARSRAQLIQGLGVAVTALAYPYGDVDGVTKHLAGACGYTFGLTCRPGLSQFRDNLLDLPRIEISSFDGLPDFIARLGAA